MAHTISISNETYSKLENLIQRFDDTPEEVINRLINNGNSHEQPKVRNPTDRGKDYTKYVFNLHPYAKNRLVLAVVKQIVDDRKGISFKKLQDMFPKEVQGSFGVFDKFEEGSKAFHKRNRFFTKPEERIELSDSIIAVCSQWGNFNIQKFIDIAKESGYEVSTAEVTQPILNQQQTTYKDNDKGVLNGN